jgi:hypothetical protein
VLSGVVPLKLLEPPIVRKSPPGNTTTAGKHAPFVVAVHPASYMAAVACQRPVLGE